VVLVATPVNLGLILNIDKPFRRVGYEVEELGKPRLTDLLSNFLEKQTHARVPEKVSTR
jgi:predicted GTPase